jgi:glycosyltransferase involved in cell wall biosynthesis
VRSAEHVDLIHELNPVCCLRSLAFLGSGLPVVLGPHSSRWLMPKTGLSLWDRVRRGAKLWLKDIIVGRQHNAANAVLLSTIAALNNFTDPVQSEGKIFVLPPGLDTEEFSPSTQAPEESPTILFLANVVTRKGVFDLLDAFFLLAARVPQARLLIAGDGPELPVVRRRVAESLLSSRIDLMGRVERSQVANVMRQCTVYCLPSHGEPFGMTAIEAMACGKPLVVTSSGGLNFMVSDDGGRRVPVRDPQSLAAALEELLVDPELCLHMGRHNRAEAEGKYAWPVIAEALESTYRSVLSKGKTSNQHLVTMHDIDRYRELASQFAQPVASARAAVAPLRSTELEAQL